VLDRHSEQFDDVLDELIVLGEGRNLGALEQAEAEKSKHQSGSFKTA
jgi:hypothetical protein